MNVAALLQDSPSEKRRQPQQQQQITTLPLYPTTISTSSQHHHQHPPQRTTPIPTPTTTTTTTTTTTAPPTRQFQHNSQPSPAMASLHLPVNSPTTTWGPAQKGSGSLLDRRDRERERPFIMDWQHDNDRRDRDRCMFSFILSFFNFF